MIKSNFKDYGSNNINHNVFLNNWTKQRKTIIQYMCPKPLNYLH